MHKTPTANWWMGENISRRQDELGWGKGVVEALARDLQAEFPGRNGFSAANLWLMRQFFNEYSPKPKLQPLVREISWAKNLQKANGDLDAHDQRLPCRYQDGTVLSRGESPRRWRGGG